MWAGCQRSFLFSCHRNVVVFDRDLRNDLAQALEFFVSWWNLLRRHPGAELPSDLAERGTIQSHPRLHRQTEARLLTPRALLACKDLGPASLLSSRHRRSATRTPSGRP